MYAYVYIYIYICVYLYTHICIRIDTQRGPRNGQHTINIFRNGALAKAAKREERDTIEQAQCQNAKTASYLTHMMQRYTWPAEGPQNPQKLLLNVLIACLLVGGVCCFYPRR